jgi:DNA polymerase-3 subunit beta
MLREMIERTVFAVSVDETRMNLSGIYLERPQAGKLRIVATDGHRLSMITRTVEGASAGSGIIIPRKGVVEISKVMETGDEPVSLMLQGGVAHATRGVVELSMRLVEGEFPDYKQVVPQKSERRLSVGVEPLLAALRRVSIVSSERTRGIKMQMDPGRLEISSINPDLGEASEEIAVDWEGEIGFNDEVSPGVLRCEGDTDYLYVVMPMRL